MTQERLDQDCRLPVGTRDALHVPFIVGYPERPSLEEMRASDFELKPGSFVKFIDEAFTKFVVCPKEEAHGVLNPFLDEISYYSAVVVLIMPGITTPVRHQFDVNLAQKQWEKQMLDSELEEAKKNDPECAECWVIQNNRLVRM